MTNQENGVDLKSAAVTEEKKLFIETYGCQMKCGRQRSSRFHHENGWVCSDLNKIEDADAIFVNHVFGSR